ncbi:MAG: glycosyltransferase family 4 protein [Acidimicrobiia bacterium]
MRVAYTLEQCWHTVPGGTARAALDVADALVRHHRGEVELVGVSARHGGPPAAPWQPPIEVRALPLPRLALYEAWHVLRRPAVQRATGAVDVIHATGVAVPPASAPLVVTVHDLAYVHDPSQFTAKGRRFFTQALGLLRRDARLVLCSSQATLDDCLAVGLPADRLRLVPLGVRPRPRTAADTTGTAAADAVRHRYGLRRPFVLSVGTLEPRKNLPRLLDAFGRLGRDDVELVLVGATGWHTAIDELVRPLGDRVRVLGFLPDADRDALYAACRLFCYPSLFEGFGLPVLEAMSAGAPVVTSAGTATAEAAGDAALLVDPHDVGAIAAALAKALDDDGLADELRAAGLTRAATFTWERTAALTAEAYREAAEGAP